MAAASRKVIDRMVNCLLVFSTLSNFRDYIDSVFHHTRTTNPKEKKQPFECHKLLKKSEEEKITFTLPHTHTTTHINNQITN